MIDQTSLDNLNRHGVARVIVACFLVFATTATGCNSNDSIGDISDLPDTQWEMTKMQIGQVEYSGASGDFTLDFTTDSVSGRSDCNLWSANYSSSADDVFILDQMTTTTIACPPASIEGPYFDMLMQVSMFDLTNQFLTLRNDNTDSIEYRRVEE